jgi:hypothetical protein
VAWRLNGGNWTQTSVSGPTYENPDITNGFYEFAITSVGSDGRISATSLEGSITALGKTAPPSNVTGLSYSTSPTLGPTFNWQPVPDLDLNTYEIRRGTASNTWNSSEFVAQVKATTYKLPTMSAGTYTYRIKAVDTQSIYSEIEASVVVDVSLPIAPVIKGTVSGTSLTLSWSSATVTTYDVSRYLLYVGDTDATKTFLTEVASLSHPITIDWLGNRTFWIVARDSADQLSTNPSSTNILISPAGAPTNIAAKWTSYGYELRWTPPKSTTSFAVKSHEIRYTSTDPSQTWYTGTYVTKTQDSFFSITLSSFDKFTPGLTRRFWIMPLDSYNNKGTAGYVDLTYVKHGAPTLTMSIERTGSVKFSIVAGTLGSLPLSNYVYRKAQITASNPNPQFTDLDVERSQLSLLGSMTVSQFSKTTFRYWVAVKDNGGNLGDAAQGSFTTP